MKQIVDCDLLWPTLESSSNNTTERREKERLENDLQLINDIGRFNSSPIILDEARRLYDQEQERRSTTDSKAATYITTSTALIAILLSLGPLILNVDVKLEFNLLSIFDIFAYVSLFLSVIILIRCMMWSNRALKVSHFHQLDWKILIEHDKSKGVELCLVQEMLRNVRQNYELTNNAVTCIKMAEALVTSAFFWFFIGMLIRIISYIYVNYSDITLKTEPFTPAINLFSICTGFT